MSFLRWFGKKEAAPDTLPEQSSDLGPVDVTLPNNRLAHLRMPVDKIADTGTRRNERLERRELLYGVVRECMTANGVLSSTYKFKVLSLDSSGRKYLIMVDMPRDYLSDAAHFVEMEGVIARSAKDRYDILVTAVYWRMNELVSAAATSTHAHAAHQPGHQSAHRVEPVAQAATLPSAKAAVPYAELQAEEVLAFKRAVAAAASAGIPRSETRKSPRRHPEDMQDFSNTEPFEPPTPLGPTQFGGLG